MLHSDENDFAEAKRLGYDLDPDTGLISDEEAQAIARSYQSSGTVGSVFASIASGVPRTREEVIDDSAATATVMEKTGQQCDDLVLIERWAEHAESDLLLEICPNCDAPQTSTGKCWSCGQYPEDV